MKQIHRHRHRLCIWVIMLTHSQHHPHRSTSRCKIWTGQRVRGIWYSKWSTTQWRCCKLDRWCSLTKIKNVWNQSFIRYENSSHSWRQMCSTSSTFTFEAITRNCATNVYTFTSIKLRCDWKYVERLSSAFVGKITYFDSFCNDRCFAGCFCC